MFCLASFSLRWCLFFSSSAFDYGNKLTEIELLDRIVPDNHLLPHTFCSPSRTARCFMQEAICSFDVISKILSQPRKGECTL